MLAVTTSPRMPRKWIRDVMARHIKLYVNDYTLSWTKARCGECWSGDSKKEYFLAPNPDLPLFVLISDLNDLKTSRL